MKEKVKELLVYLNEILYDVKDSMLCLVLITLLVGFSIMFGYFSYQKFEYKKEIDTNGINVPAKYVGQFSISHYCSCPICTGTAKGSKTATGHVPKEGRTVAVDKHIIPLHSVIYVEGLGSFVAEDVGGAVKGNHLDIYIDDHQRALNLGTLKGAKPKVYILK